MPFKELLLNRVRPTIIEATENQNYPIETLLFKLDMPFSTEEFPLFDIVILLENFQDKKYILHTNPNIIFSFLRTDTGIKGEVEYNTRRYAGDTIRRIVGHLLQVIKEVIFNVDIPLSHPDILSTAEKKQLLYDFNHGSGKPDTTGDETLHRLFTRQVERTPDHIAIIGPSVPPGAIHESHLHRLPLHITYKELNEKSDRMARRLHEKGIGPDTIIGIMGERSPEMIFGMLGILKSGGAYLPIDPDYPEERQRYILKDSGAQILVTHLSSYPSWLSGPNTNGQLSIVNCQSFMDGEKPTAAVCSTPHPTPGNRQLAYIIYTSGSTGHPKGVLIEHRQVVSLMFHDHYLFEFDNRDVWTMFHSFSFDFSVWEMYGALLYGGKLVIIPKMTARDPQQFLDILKKEQVTILNQTPLAFYNLAHHELAVEKKQLKLKYVIFGGEALTPGKLKEWIDKYPGTKLVNMFGITETTVHVTYKELEEQDIRFNKNTIGRPLPPLTGYVTDKHLRLVPLGAVGEICVGGKGVCRGYLNRPELTAEKLVKNPYITGERIYRSGDLGKWQPGGELEYLGRMDHQVKVRGYRVELGEIQDQLIREPQVKDAVVTSQEDSDGSRVLAAYVCPDPQYARPICQILELEKTGRTRNRSSHQYPNGMTIFYINRNETDFMYREIFAEDSYIKHGITLPEGACIFDVGANIGMFSLFTYYTCKNPKIYAFEPLPPIFELLSLNTSIYCPGIEIFPLALAQEEGEAVFTYYPHASVLSGRFADKSQETETVKAFIKNEQAGGPTEERLSDTQVNELLEDRLKGTPFTCKMKPLSQVLRETGVEQIDLLKIDVEKGEIDVLNGIDAADWRKIRQLVIEVHDVDGRLQEITRRLEQLDYRVTVEQDKELINTGLYNIYATSEEKKSIPRGKNKSGLPGNIPAHCLSPGRFIDDLRSLLKEKLPEYMVPAYFILLDRIPLTPNGKVDRQALPAPDIKAGTEYIPPRNPLEEKMAGIWAEVLGIEKEVISMDANFFDLGGHSLKATNLIAKMQKSFDIKVPLGELFKTPTPRELAAFIKKESARFGFASIPPVEKREYYPLSSAQKRLFFLHQVENINTSYNITGIYHLEGKPDKERFKKVFTRLVKRHEALRTSFTWLTKDMINKPVQRIFAQVEIDIREIEAGERPLEELIHSFIRPFDLEIPPLLRVGLIRLSNPRYLLLYDMHHIITDGTSMGILAEEFAALYNDQQLPPRKIQYIDFCQWQNHLFESGHIKEEENFWLQLYKGKIPVPDMPVDFPRSGHLEFAGDAVQFKLDRELTRSISDLLARQNVTLYMFLLAVYNILLAKYTGQEDIIVGTPIAGRLHADLENVMGMFVNMLPMRNFPEAEKTFRQFLVEVRENSLKAFENQHYQFEMLIDKLDIKRDPGRNPLFDTTFVVQNTKFSSIQLDIEDFKLIPYYLGHTFTPFEMVWEIEELDDEIHFSLVYSKELYKRQTIETIVRHYIDILRMVVREDDCQIIDIELATGQPEPVLQAANLKEQLKNKIQFEF